jgi:hypothetical protein
LGSIFKRTLEEKLKMATESTTLTLPLAHLYYLTADTNNQTGYTLEEDSEEYTQIQNQISSVEQDILMCQEHISSIS